MDDEPVMRDVFFELADAKKRPNGVVVAVLQTKPKVRGGKPEPVKIICCRAAGALALIEALTRALRR
jgi:hypothetical protein